MYASILARPQRRDGVKVASTTDAHSLNAKGGNGVFPGDVDEFAVYPFVLSPAQIAAHWKAAE